MRSNAVVVDLYMSRPNWNFCVHVSAWAHLLCSLLLQRATPFGFKGVRKTAAWSCLLLRTAKACHPLPPGSGDLAIRISVREVGETFDSRPDVEASGRGACGYARDLAENCVAAEAWSAMPLPLSFRLSAICLAVKSQMVLAIAL
jgi:hypothetical protein